MNENQIYLSMYKDFTNIARIDVENFEILNFGEFYLEDIVVQDADADGLIEPDEQVYIIPSISVDFKSTGVIGNIFANDPEVIYINAESNFGDILPDEIVHNATDPFVIQISSNPNSTIILSFEFTTNYGYNFVMTYPIQISLTNSDNELIQTDRIELSNHPNPFNPSTTISFNLNSEITENTELVIYNLKGQKIRTFSHAELVEV